MRYFLTICLLSFALVACGSAPTPTTPAATATAEVVPTVGLVATPTPAPTAVSTVGVPTVETPTEVPATPTATTAAINPLTGLAVSDPSVLARRPLAIKVANFPRRVRLDQNGLSLADNVWEHYAEGGTTRFTAIFLSQGPERIGNVRSARLLDAYLGSAYAAILVASGSSTGTMNRLRETDFFERVIAEATGYGGCPVLCREASASETTDKLYTSAPALWALADEKGFNGPQPLPGFAFEAAPPSGGQRVTTLRVNFQLDNTVTEWRYDASTGLYERWIDTANMPELERHVDHYNNQFINAATIVLVSVPYTPSNIRETEGGKVYYSYDIPLVGRGPARVFRDGVMLEGEWVREDNGLPRLVDAQGQPIAFHPGVIWFVPVDPDSPFVYTADQSHFQIRFKVPPPGEVGTATPVP